MTSKEFQSELAKTKTYLELDPTEKQLLSRQVYDVIGAIHEVHNELGPGLPEYVYQEALAIALTDLRATRFPIGILANFGTHPKATIERYHFRNGLIYAF